MREMLDGNWAAAEATVDIAQRVSGHDLNMAIGCLSQRGWIASETGALEAEYPIMRARLVIATAEAGHHDEAATLLDTLAPDDFAAVGRGWLTTLALGSVAWAAITVDAREHVAVLRRLLGEYSGLMARIASGTFVMCAYDRLLTGLAAVDGDQVEADRLFAAALAQGEGLRAPPLLTRTKHWWGRALMRRGELVHGRSLLAEARASAENLGMRAVVTQIDDLLAAS